MNASGSVTPSEEARYTCPKKSSIKVVRGAVVGSSGVMARPKDLWRGYSPPGIQLAELRPSWLSSSRIMRISDAEALTE